jgi:hypothetical protein
LVLHDTSRGSATAKALPRRPVESIGLDTPPERQERRRKERESSRIQQLVHMRRVLDLRHSLQKDVLRELEIGLLLDTPGGQVGDDAHQSRALALELVNVDLAAGLVHQIPKALSASPDDPPHGLAGNEELELPEAVLSATTARDSSGGV